MTNLQQGGSGLSGALLRRLWLGLPIAAGGALALLLTALVLLPQWLALQGNMKRLSELEQLRNQLGLTRSHLNATATSIEKVQAQQAKLFEIVTGSGDLSTFLATLDQLAKANRVQLDLYEPQADGKSPDRNKDGRVDDQEKKAKPAADPLEVDGMQRNSLELAARGSYPQLLEFLRQLEALNVLVVQTDLQLNLEGANANAPAGPAATGPEALRPRPVVLNMLLGLYNKTPEASKPGGSK